VFREHFGDTLGLGGELDSKLAVPALNPHSQTFERLGVERKVDGPGAVGALRQLNRVDHLRRKLLNVATR
jgi:hypothetical protein